MRKLMVLCTMLVFSAVTVVSAQTVMKKTDAAPQKVVLSKDMMLKTTPGAKTVTNPLSQTHMNPGTVQGQHSATSIKPQATPATKQPSAITVKQTGAQAPNPQVHSAKTGTVQAFNKADVKTKSAATQASVPAKKLGAHAPVPGDANFAEKMASWKQNYYEEYKAFMESQKVNSVK